MIKKKRKSPHHVRLPHLPLGEIRLPRGGGNQQQERERVEARVLEMLWGNVSGHVQESCTGEELFVSALNPTREAVLKTFSQVNKHWGLSTRPILKLEVRDFIDSMSMLYSFP